VKVLCRPDGDVIDQLITVGAVTFVGVALGLTVSAAARTVDVAATLVPVVIIPQFVLAGAVIAVTGLAKLLACLAALYWGYKGVLASEPQFFRGAIDTPDWAPAHFMLFFHAAIYIAAGWALLRMKDKGQTTADLIRLTRRAMSDPNGPAARYLATAKASLASGIHFTADRERGLSRLLQRQPNASPAPLPAIPPPLPTAPRHLPTAPPARTPSAVPPQVTVTMPTASRATTPPRKSPTAAPPRPSTLAESPASSEAGPPT
jgi:hypothetical protein